MAWQAIESSASVFTSYVNKVYRLHAPDIDCIGKGKAHKPYEYGRKASVVTTLGSQVIVGVASHDQHGHDSKTLKDALASAQEHRKRLSQRRWLIALTRAASEALQRSLFYPVQH